MICLTVVIAERTRNRKDDGDPCIEVNFVWNFLSLKKKKNSFVLNDRMVNMGLVQEWLFLKLKVCR